MASGTDAAALIRFLGESPQSGLQSSLMATHLSRTVKSVMGAAFDSSWRRVDIDSIDVDTVFRAYLESNPNLKPSTQEEYRRRFERAIVLFKEHRASTATEASVPKTSSVEATGEVRDAGAVNARGISTAGSARWQGELITYPFPLRPGCVVFLQLPADLESAEVDRLVIFLKALATDV